MVCLLRRASGRCCAGRAKDELRLRNATTATVEISSAGDAQSSAGLRSGQQDAGAGQGDARQLTPAQEDLHGVRGRVAGDLPFAQVAVAGHQQQAPRTLQTVGLALGREEETEDLRLEAR